MSITLHTAVEDVRNLLEQVDPETGELPLEYGPARELVERKAVGVTAFIVQQERELSMARDYVQEVQGRIVSAEKRIAWLRSYLEQHMAALGITKVTDERGLFSATLSVERDVSVEVFDEAQLPVGYTVEKTTSRPDKKLIRQALDDGFAVPGARLKRSNRLTVK